MNAKMVECKMCGWTYDANRQPRSCPHKIVFRDEWPHMPKPKTEPIPDADGWLVAENLAMLLRRLIGRVTNGKDCADLIAKCNGYIIENGLHGAILRDDE